MRVFGIRDLRDQHDLCHSRELPFAPPGAMPSPECFRIEAEAFGFRDKDAGLGAVLLSSRRANAYGLTLLLALGCAPGHQTRRLPMSLPPVTDTIR